VLVGSEVKRRYTTRHHHPRTPHAARRAPTNLARCLTARRCAPLRASLCPLLCALLCVTALAACGPPPSYNAPFISLSRPSPDLLAADILLRTRARGDAWVATAVTASQFADVRALTLIPIEAFDPYSPDTQQRAATFAYADGRIDDGLAILAAARERGQETPALIAFHVEQLVLVGRFPIARDLAQAALDRFYPDDSLAAAADLAIDRDPLLLPPTIHAMTPDKDLTAIKALGGGSTVTLRLLDGERTIGAFKPDQDLGQSMYRSEVAYYRLCALLRCSFRVPYNAHVRIERAAFSTLYARIDSDKQRNYRGKLSHMTWTLDPQDGLDYVHGTLKEWVPDFGGFNIEVTEAWSPFLKLDTSTSALKQDAATLLRLVTSLSPPDAPSIGGLYRRLEGVTIRQLVQQLSDLLVMDFLTNNWDRFSGYTELFGANCHVEPGGVIAIDNGAAFPEWNTPRVAHRLKLTQRFSRRLILSIRRLDRDQTLARLFPNPTKKEIKRFDIFWARRAELLTYVDALIAHHGEERVLLFD
jgi:hypothetical protein